MNLPGPKRPFPVLVDAPGIWSTFAIRGTALPRARGRATKSAMTVAA